MIACMQMKEVLEMNGVRERVLQLFKDENLNNYDMTVLTLAIIYKLKYPDEVMQENIEKMANILGYSEESLSKVLANSIDMNESEGVRLGRQILSIFELRELPDFFSTINEFIYINNQFSKISYKTDYDSIISNLELYEGIYDKIGLINGNISFNESYYRKENNKAQFTKTSYLNIYILCKTYIESTEEENINKDLINLAYLVIDFYFQSIVNTLQLVLMIQVIKYSPYYDNSVHNIANMFYNETLLLLRNAIIVEMQTNGVYFNKSIIPQYRSRKDNTSRIQIVYGYENFDSYFLRVDLAHKGVNYTHFNNESPGGTKCYFFTDEERIAIIKKHPNFKSYFYEIEGKWFLVERNKCRREDLNDYICVSGQKEHVNCFGNEDEKSIITFIDDLSKMLPQNYLSNKDVNDDYKKNCFNFSRLMNEIAILFIHLFDLNGSTDLNKIAKDILNKAVRYNIIKKEDFTDDYDLDTFYIIASEAKEKLSKY